MSDLTMIAGPEVEVRMWLIEEQVLNGRSHVLGHSVGDGLVPRLDEPIDSGAIQVVAVTDPLTLGFNRQAMIGINADGEGSPIARAVINMAHALNISVTAEGVETQAQMLGLRELGCERAQGFYFGRPTGADEFSAILSRQIDERT